MNENTVHISKKKVLVIGELLADLISEKDIESLAFSSGFVMSQGGSSANLCANLKWMNVDAELIGSVGDDGLGTYLINEIKEAGLSDKYLTRLSNFQTSLVLVGKSKNTPDFIAYRSADIQINKIDDSLINDAKLLHTTAFALSKDPAKSNILNAFSKAYKLGKYLSVDWNYAPTIWNDDNGINVFKQICRFKPLIKISLDDIERFTGRKLSIEESMQELNNIDVSAICLTCGKDGVWFKKENSPWIYKAALSVKEVISVTGAGDAFWAGFLAYFIEEKPIAECIDNALITASKKIGKLEPLYKRSLI
ncbi:carbohydrate kinase family protein [Pedobacter jamesrossensis]|uniref:Carbohydrate kinase family protein n=1 Tax=Pedobacter jamesrossensis TaxID=1908238 RepID=A0ABV8NQE4_9SPHI